MNEGALQRLVEELSLTVFGKPFKHEALYNKRLRTTGGRYMLNDHSIQINPKVYELYGREELIGVIKHELCHYHLHLEGKGYQHRDADFKQLLKKTDSPRYCRPLTKKQSSTKIYRYACCTCGLLYERKKRMNVSNYRCGKCTGSIRFIESVSLQ